jgi:hypothetical protein
MADHGPQAMELVEVRAEDILAERRTFYERFMSGASWAIGATVAVLALMWIFLV